ncbi:hypothetical protein CBR_g64882 [Chara braunii]|uniref:Integrase catalytic domain-containing protein n=1 Tax=Chara braunii TaxID=69332 RepID=A0A388K985_CHABU|nr:hypothetical protein CBR_g64882 [Chara braunii]|eukprot:GBG66610.1 hypothetical protein CBR_g64882 [Chara braunii]
MEKEEEILRIIRERRAAEGHRIPDEIADTMKIGVEGFLTAEEAQLIRKVCQEFHLAFAFNELPKGRLDANLISPVRIHTVEHECWKDKGSAYEFGIAAEVTELLRAKIDSFVVEPIASPYANKWFVFRKPNKTLRWIQDLQKLNAVTIRDAGSLPQVDLLAESHAGRSIYSLIDLYSGYDQLPLDARDRPYTAMHTSVGQLQMYILDARDNLSGYVEAVALKRKTGKGVADWIEDFYLRHPFVRRFIADNGTEFVNHEQAVFSENMTPKRTTGCIPTKLWYEREIDFPVEALVPTWNRLDDNPHMSTEELIVARCQQVVRNEEALEDVVKRVMDSRMRDKARWDQVKNIRNEPLQVGEKVLVRNSALESTWSGQLERRFKGPYKIAKRVGLNTFELEDLDGTGIKGSFPGQRPTREQPTRQAGESSSRKRKLYVGFDHNLVVNRGGRKQGTRGPLPLREGEPIVLPFDSDTSSEEEGSLGKRQRMEEEEPKEVIDLSSEEEEDEVTTPTREVRGRDEDPGDEKDKWIREFGSSFSDWFNQWASIMRYEWAMKGKEKLSRGEDIAPTTFLTEEEFLQMQRTKRKMQQEIDNRAREARRRATGQSRGSRHSRE